jgi:hypothetical protein
MENPLNKEELIEAYIRQELSADQTQSFEAELAGDVDLQHELSMQRDIISVIKESRRLEFKAKLDAINIKTPFINTNYMIAGISGIAAIALISFYTLFNSPEITVSENDLAQSETIDESQSIELEEAIEDKSSKSLVEEKSIEQTEIESESPIVSEVTSDFVIELESGDNEELEDESSETIANITKPTIPGEGNGEGFAISQLDSESTGKTSSELRKVSKFDVEITSNDKYGFHYKFYNSKLYLYGDFSKSTYELLELNSNGQRNLYMYFDNKYYALDNNQLKITKLTALKDRATIHGLNNLR